MKALHKLPVPWNVTFRVLEKVGKTKPKRPVVFECVGVPGIIDQIITAAPINSRVVVAGVCMEPDPPGVLAAEIVEELEAALAQFAELAASLPIEEG